MKKIFLTIIATLTVMVIYSQENAGAAPKQQNRHEIYLGGGGGISTLNYNPTIGKRCNELGWLAGLGYTYYLNYNWGISIGAEYQQLKGSWSLSPNSVDNFLDEYLVSSPNFTSLQVYPRTKIKEQQKLTYINIPVLARYKFNFWTKHRLEVAAGLKVGIPLGDIDYTSSGELETTGYDAITRDNYVDLPKYGFSKYTSANGSFADKLNFIGVLEAGIKWQLGRKWGLYTGLFADFGINDILKRDNDNLNYLQYNYQNPSQPTINTILLSNYGQVNYGNNGGVESEQRFAKYVHTLAIGAKVAVTFGFKPFNKKEKAKEEVTTPWEDPWDKPVTGNQMRELLNDQTNDLKDSQREQFEQLKQFIADELAQPDLSAPIYCFDFDKDNIPSDMKAVLDHKAELMKKYPLVYLTIEGHTDADGSDKYNYNLGLRRAESAKYYLVQKGIAGSRLQVTSKGRKEPIIKNSKGDHTANCPNRRVEFIIRK